MWREEMKVKIIRLGREDAWYHDRKRIIGITSRWEYTVDMDRNWTGGKFISDTEIEFITFEDSAIHFAYVKFEEVKE